MAHAALHPQPIPPHAVRHGVLGKPRRPVGDPVASLKEITRFEPIPTPAPQQLSVSLAIFDPKANQSAEAAGKLVFHCVGDVGGVNGTATQEAIAVAMEEQIKAAADADRPSFLYIVGDVVYYNGQQKLYRTEFYEPYQYYPALIFAIPGNHDGDTHVRKNDPPDVEPSLFGFMENFCDSSPRYANPYRMTMTQPYPFWTLDAPFVTIIGLYSNVEGNLDARGRSDQQHFLVSQLQNAPKDKHLLITVHHPPYSLDSTHGGCPDILNALERAISMTGRTPNAILSGHVHNYQRFGRKANSKKIPYVVAGAGGYANDARSMHKLQKELSVASKKKKFLPYPTTISGVTLENFQQEEPGFLRVTVDGSGIQFEYFLVPFDGSPVRLFERFTA